MSISSAVPVGQPLHGASFGQSVARFFKGYVVFSGRASRSEFWWATLFTFLISLVVQIPFWIVWAGFMAQAVAAEQSSSTAVQQELLGMSGGLLAAIAVMVVVSLAIVLPTYAVTWRRLQDANFHGAFSLLSLVGLSIVPLVMCLMPSHPAGVRFDPGFRASVGWDQGFGAAPVQPSAGFGYPQAPYGDPAASYQPPAGSPYGPTVSPAYDQPPYGGPAYGQPAPRYGNGDEYGQGQGQQGA